MEDHPTAEDFRNLLQQSSRPASREQNASAVRHLLAGCEICRSTVRDLPGARSLLARMFDLPLPDSVLANPADRYTYDWAFMRVSKTLTHHLNQGLSVENLPDLLAELSELPEGEQIRRVSSERRFASADFVHHLIKSSDSVRYQNARKMLHFARLACSAAELCTAEAADGDRTCADLQAYAYATYGNAQRICSNFLEAERAFDLAFQNYQEGKSPRLRAFLLLRYLPLRIAQGFLEEALRLAEEEERLCLNLGDQQLLATAQVQKAIALLYANRPEEATHTLQNVIPLIDDEADPYLLLAAHHNLARCYLGVNRSAEALALHYENREFYQNCKAPLILLRAHWQEGLLLREIGHMHNAESALLRAFQGYREEGIAYEAALVCLDLADLYWALESFDKLRRVLFEALPVFRSLRASQETLAVLLRLEQVAQRESTERKSLITDSAPSLLLFPGTPPRESGPDDL